MKTYLILGAGGFCGVQMVRYLLSFAPTVRVIGVGRNPERAAAFSPHRGIDDGRYEYHQIHLVHESERLGGLIEQKSPEVIVNFAAQSEEAASWTSSWRYFETNAVALAKVVEPLVGASWLKKWVQIGTSAVYGSRDEAVAENCPLCPGTPYAASKAAADFYLLSVARERRFPVNILRPSNVYGPGQQLHRIIPKAVLCALLGRTLPLEGGGAARRSYLHVEDLSRAIYLIAEHALPGVGYNAGPKDATTVRALVEMACEKVGVPFSEVVRIAPARLGQDVACILDCSRIEADVGWRPRIGLENGLDGTIAWVKQHLDFLKTQPTEFTFQA